MSPGLAAALLGSLALAPLGTWLGRRLRWLPVLLQVLAAVAVIFTALHSLPLRPVAAGLTATGLGRLLLSRLTAAILVGGWAAALLELGATRRRNPRPGGIALQLLVGVACSAALALTGLIPLAVLLASVLVAVWVRWQHLGGPSLPVRSLARQAAVVLCALLAAAAVLPAERVGAAPAVLVGVLLVGGFGGVAGLLPLSSWVGAVSRVGPAEGSLWRIWLVPLGVISLARVLATEPEHLTQVLQILLIALGMATTIFWGAAALVAPAGNRYQRVLAADVGFMCAGVAAGDALGLAGAVLLVVVHWLAGSTLAEAPVGRAQLLAWLGVSGVPPFGGFSARLLILVGASFMGPLVLGGTVLAFGLQLAAGGAGIGEALRRSTVRGPALSEALGLAAAVATLALGIFAQPVLRLAFGIRL
ncbi:MAG: proton-conducting transporter membrane subunit [Candidatus Dormibacteria bacterium]